MAFNRNIVQDSVIDHAEVTGIATNTLTLLLSVTATSFMIFIDEIIATGQVDAEFHVVLNGATKIIYCTSEQMRTMDVEVPIRLEKDGVIQVFVKHYETGSFDFSSSIISHNQC